MLNFGKFLFNEAVTMNGKKIGDDNDTTTTNTGSTNTNNATNTGSTSTPSMGVDDDSDYTKMGRDDDTGTANTSTTGSDSDDVDDYTKMPRDDNTSTTGIGGTGTSSLGGTSSTDTTSGGADTTSSTPGITPADNTTTTGTDTGGAEDEVDDYTKMSRDDDSGGTTPTGTDTGATGTDMGAGTDTTTGGGDTPPADGSDSGDVDDYTKMPRDDTPGGDAGATTPDAGGTDAGGTGTTGGTAAGGGGDQPQGGGGAAEDDNVEDYTQTPRDGEEGDPSTGGDASTDPNAGTTDPQQELRDIESKLFSELSPEQLQIKDNELKIQYINLYEDIEKTEQRVNRIVKTENNEDVVAFISKKLDDLKTLVHRILTETYQTQTWLQNMLTYQHCLSIFAGIGELLHHLSKKDNINKNIDNDDKIEDLTNDVITSTNTEG